MPLLCISLLALLLLPLSLSCDTQKPPKNVSEDYTPVIETLLSNAWIDITTRLKNSTCENLRYKPQNCKESLNQDFVSTLHNLSCDMRHLNLSETAQLTWMVLQSIQCPCPQTKGLAVAEEDGKMRRKRQKKHKRKMKKMTRKLCKAKMILSNMTECYQMLNTIVRTTDSIAGGFPLS